LGELRGTANQIIDRRGAYRIDELHSQLYREYY
jgi:hypothetical protein